jgi:UDP-4-amino-4,6-dideoxy-L-N-acetyl-beta-L-altrosamine transaminase
VINLFNIPSYKIDTSEFSHPLHGTIVTEFENKFAQYVGAKYAVSFNSATSAIFLLFKHIIKPVAMKVDDKYPIRIPSLIPPVVANSLIHAGFEVCFTDNISWVGSSYVMGCFDNIKVIDSAQEVSFSQYSSMYQGKDVIIYSFYPTKPVGSFDGGMIVSNNKDIIDQLRELSMNGMSSEASSWDRKINSVGYKMYMNSFSAAIAMRALTQLPDKKMKLWEIRSRYDLAFHTRFSNGDHLYRVPVKNNRETLEKAAAIGIGCGIHYRPAHLMPVYNADGCPDLLLSEAAGQTMLSIPFHENLTEADQDKVIKFIKPFLTC